MTTANTTNTANTKVLIVGAGPVGLTLALQLARRAVPFLLIDSKEKPTDQSRALGIQARTLEMFDQLEVIGPVLDRGRKIRKFRASDSGKTVVEINIDLADFQTNYPYIVVLPQSDTEQILIDRLTANQGEIAWKTTLQGFEQTASGVTATIENAETGVRTTVEADWIVGCDGAHSAVRHGLNTTFDGAAYPELFLLADARVDWDLEPTSLQVLLTSEGAMIAFPLPSENHWRLVDTAGLLDSNDPKVVTQHFQDRLRANGFPEVTVTEPDWVAGFHVHRRLAGTLQNGRAFLAGDAGHIHSPAGGQGMNTGIQDACNLGWKLALVVQGRSPKSLLDSYSAERLPVVAGVLKGTDLLTQVVTLESPILKAVRNRLASFVSRFDAVQKRLSRAISELDINYRRSPIVGQSWLGTVSKEPTPFRANLRAGDRVPDVTFQSTRLFDKLRGTEHTLLLFDAKSDNPETLKRFQELAQKIEVRYGSAIKTLLVTRSETSESHWEGAILKDHGRLHEHFGADEPAIYLIRPDLYIGYRSRSSHSQGVEAHLRTIFL